MYTLNVDHLSTGEAAGGDFDGVGEAEVLALFGGEDGVMFDVDEMNGDIPDRFFRGHPALFVETGEIDWLGEAAEGFATVV